MSFALEMWVFVVHLNLWPSHIMSGEFVLKSLATVFIVDFVEPIKPNVGIISMCLFLTHNPFATIFE